MKLPGVQLTHLFSQQSPSSMCHHCGMHQKYSGEGNILHLLYQVHRSHKKECFPYFLVLTKYCSVL